MFQIAAAIGLSLKYNIPYCIPKHTLDDKRWPLYNFKNINYCDDIDGANTAEVYTEPSFVYTEIRKPTHRNIILNGFFQSYLYFHDFRKEILNAFWDIRTWHRPLHISDTIFIHYRLGDYKHLEKCHKIISDEYINSSLEYFYSQGYKKFMVFSDEIKEAKEKINSERYKALKFDYSYGAEFWDLSFMASCAGGIMSASSFSWWGAYLGTNEDRIIIYPKNWFGESLSYHDTSTLCPPNWIAL